MLKIGQKAPDFELLDDRSKPFRLADASGQPVVLYFYPKDDSETCNVENSGFSDLAAKFAKSNAVLLGISPDSVESHKRFRAKYGLKVRLLADPEHKAIVPYKVWGPKKLYGRDYMGLIRTTYLIDAKGNVAEAWKVTRARGHAEKVLDAVKALSQSTT
ncbi:MAG: peroxiredoxin [Hyphomicrobiaceae bacterium]|nr:peroxiredoxin [Hyphomicrobiaceae bacterium]MCC0023546.1 peroxiredoxin [Hyphomicrobiaceae bacterium]